MKKIRAWLYKNAYWIYLSVLMLLLFFMVFYNSIFFNIYPGERGVVWRRFDNGVSLDRVYGEGFRAIPPWDIMYIYNTRIQAVTDTVYTIVGEDLPIRVQYTVHFQPKRDSIARLHDEIGPDYIRVILVPLASSVTRTVLSRVRADSLYNADREAIEDSITSNLQRSADLRFVLIKEVLIREIKLPDSLVIAINEKLAEKQRVETYVFRLQREREEAKRKAIEAGGLKAFQDTSGISALLWRGIQATEKLANSNNAKIIVIGTDSSSLPLILGAGQ